jgi:hypothetical protein
MKVSELIAALGAFPPDLPVIISAEAGEKDHSDVAYVLIDFAVLRGDGGVDLTYPDDGAGQTVIRLCGPEGPGESYYRNAAADD